MHSEIVATGTNAIQAILDIQSLARNEQNLGSNMPITIAERAPVWRKQVADAESDIGDHVSVLLEAAKEARAKREAVRILS